MYSPKIAEELIPDLYRIKKEMQVPMTGLVNYILGKYIKERNCEKSVDTLGGDENVGSS